MGWTSIYQLFWGSLGTRVLTHPQVDKRMFRAWSTPQAIPRNPTQSHTYTRLWLRLVGTKPELGNAANSWALRSFHRQVALPCLWALEPEVPHTPFHSTYSKTAISIKTWNMKACKHLQINTEKLHDEVAKSSKSNFCFHHGLRVLRVFSSGCSLFGAAKWLSGWSLLCRNAHNQHAHLITVQTYSDIFILQVR